MGCLEVSLAVHTHTPEETTRAVEALSRVMTGLALDDLGVQLTIEDPSYEFELDQGDESVSSN